MSQGFAKSEDAVNDHGQLGGLTDDDHSFYPKGILGYAKVTSAQNNIGTGSTDITSATATVTVAADRIIKITGNCLPQAENSGDTFSVAIHDGSGEIGRIENTQAAVNNGTSIAAGPVLVDSPAAGSQTYKLVANFTSGTSNRIRGDASPTLIIVEDIGPA